MQNKDMLKIKYLFESCLFVVIVMVASCTPATKPASTPVEKKENPETIVANIAPAYEEQILNAVNNYRKKKGLPVLQSNFVISAEARKHSMNMATRRTPFGHNGISARTKIITGKVNGVSFVAENVAHGSMSAQEVVNGWIQSSGHRKNMEGNYTLTGIGVARNQKSELYFTQIFAR